MIGTKTILAGLLMLCGMAQFTPAMGQQTVETHEVRNYFYLHDTIPQTCLKITSQEQFDRYFGPAAFMGKDGEPTQIDFGREFVVAKVFPLTDRNIKLENARLTLEGDSQLVLRYTYIQGRQQSYTIRPFILLSAPIAYSHLPIEAKADSLYPMLLSSRVPQKQCRQNTASNGVLIIWYDSKTGKKPLLRSVRRKRCKLIYDYKMLSGIAVSVPQNADMQSIMQYFRGVKGVLSVDEDRMLYLDSPSQMMQPAVQ